MTHESHQPRPTTNHLGWTAPYQTGHELSWFIDGNTQYHHENPAGGEHFVHVVLSHNSYMYLSLGMWVDNADQVYRILEGALAKRMADHKKYHGAAGMHEAKWEQIEKAIKNRSLYITPVPRTQITRVGWAHG